MQYNRSKPREERVCYTLAAFRGHVHEANCKYMMNQPQFTILQEKERFTFVHSFNQSEVFGFAAQVKQPGLEMQTVQSELDLSYKQRYQDVSIPEAYERLILDT